MNCLRCSESLQVVKNEDVEVDVCLDGCGGIWFDVFELKKMNEKHEVSASFLNQVSSKNYASVDTTPRLKCPKCKSITMLRHFYSIKKEVTIDHCGGCAGYWLDGGELEAVLNQFETEAEKTRATHELFSKLMTDEVHKALQKNPKNKNI